MALNKNIVRIPTKTYTRDDNNISDTKIYQI